MSLMKVARNLNFKYKFLNKNLQYKTLMTTRLCYNIIMSDVKILRRKTGAGISLCIDALKKSNNDQNKAIDYIQEIFSNSNEEKVERLDEDVKPGLVGILTNAQNNFALITKVKIRMNNKN